MGYFNTLKLLHSVNFNYVKTLKLKYIIKLIIEGKNLDDENKLYLQWIVYNQQVMSFKDFKDKSLIKHVIDSDAPSKEEVLKNVFNIIKYTKNYQ